MPILTKPATITKGIPATFTLDPLALESHPGITDEYYSHYSNWKKVVFFYRSAVGNQPKSVAFDIEEGKLSNDFITSPKVRNLFHLQTIFLYDYDGAFFPLERKSLSSADKAEMDVAL